MDPARPTTTRHGTVATFLTREPVLTLPPGVLQPNERYAFFLIAYLTPGVDFASKPYALDVLYDVAYASAVTSILTAPADLTSESAQVLETEPVEVLQEFEEPGRFRHPKVEQRL